MDDRGLRVTQLKDCGWKNTGLSDKGLGIYDWGIEDCRMRIGG